MRFYFCPLLFIKTSGNNGEKRGKQDWVMLCVRLKLNVYCTRLDDHSTVRNNYTYTIVFTRHSKIIKVAKAKGNNTVLLQRLTLTTVVV